MIIAKAGERVMDAETGKVICRVASDIVIHQIIMVSDFHKFSAGEAPWKSGEQLDPRCFRGGAAGIQVFVEGEWRP